MTLSLQNYLLHIGSKRELPSLFQFPHQILLLFEVKSQQIRHQCEINCFMQSDNLTDRYISAK